MPYILLMPIFADDILKVGATGMGVLLSVSGIGAIAGSLTLASLPNKKRGTMLLVSSLILGLALVGFSLSSSWYLSLALIVFVGLGQTGRMTLGNTLLQYYTEDEYRGRVMSVYLMEFGLMSFGVFAAGLIAEAMGVQWAVGGFAIVLVFLSILALAFVPRLRKLD
jgi:MFS family permease